MKTPLSVDTYPYYFETLEYSTGLKKIFYKVLPIPLHTFFPLRAEIYMLWIRFKSWYVPLKYKKAQDLLVNLGAGSSGKSGWVNVDVMKFPQVNCIYDVRKKLPFPDNSVRAIFCEHFFEHIDYTEEVPYFLSEVYRVLQPGGVIRIIVPDAEKYMHGYCADDWNMLQQVRPLDDEKTDAYYKFKYRTKMELVNMVFRQGHRHKYAYDFETLHFLLRRYGFSEVYKQAFKVTLMDVLALDRDDRAAESLYVEAIKR